jgi:adenosylmethionine-8-amino-7-oxononanoate aminotransferase
MTSVFGRGASLEAVAAEGSWIVDRDGRHYLDAAGGAIVCGVGHGRREVIEAISAQLSKTDYVHASTFTTSVVEQYSAEIAARVPMTDARVYPVSGGSEAMETALKLALTYQQLRGDRNRTAILSRWGSYHGNTLGALDVSGRVALRAPYESWLGRAGHVPPVYEYRCPAASHPTDCGAWHADFLEERITEQGNVAAFVAESVGGATLGAVVPPPDYWPAVAEVCRRYGVLLIIDEVMTGFGRTGKWFGIDHWEVRPDVIVAGKGASSGYWPLGLCIASGAVHAVTGEAFVHGYTYSHHPAGAAAGLAVLEILDREELVEAASVKGNTLRQLLSEAMAAHPNVGDVRGIGLLVAVELVSDRTSKEPYPREAKVTERIMQAARDAGLLLYPASKGIDGVMGDAVLIGPPLSIGADDLEAIVERTQSAVEAVLPS